MSELNIEQLLQNISAEKPCGDDLSYDPEFMELERLIQGTPEREMGDVKVAAEEPDWRDMSRRCLSLLERTRDLRILVYLALAELKLRGAPGFRDGVVLLQRSITSYWPTLFPALDPDDNNDPTFRVNAIAAMSPGGDTFGDPLNFPERLRNMTLAESRQAGRVCLRDILLSTGELPARENDQKREPAAIDAVFKTADPEQIAATAQAIDETIIAWDALDAGLTQNAGVGHAVDIGATRKILATMQMAIRQRTGSASGMGAGATSPMKPGDNTASTSTSVAGTVSPGNNSSPGSMAAGIRSREDCKRAIDDICRFIESTEPSSPVPILLKRARRLIDKSFMDVISDLTPDALAAIKNLAGTQNEGSE
jgi:type VI secretion system protein ImpA